MTGKRSIILLLVGTAVVLFLLATPAMIKAVPPRYLSRLPQPIQDFGAPKQEVAILPTVAVTADLSFLLTPSATPTADLPPTNTAVPAAIQFTLTPEATEPLPPTFTPPPPTATPLPIPPQARLEGVTHKFQEWNNCGPATLAMTLTYFNIQASQADTAAFLKPSPEDRNVSPFEMVAYVQEKTDLEALFRVNGDQQTIQRLLAAGFPVILEIGIEPPGEFQWMGWYGHYMLAVAYDNAKQQFWVYDSWLGTSEVPLENANPDGRTLTYQQLDEFWPHFNHNYIVLYEPERADEVAAIIGEEMDDTIMWQNALAEVQAQIAANPENAFYWFNLGTAYNALGHFEEAAAAYDQARAIGLPWRMLWYQFGPYQAYYEAGRYEDVLLLADTTLKDRPYFEESFYYRGLALAALGETKAARQDLEKAASFNPNFIPAADALASLDSGG
ncbi:MAG: C39 family peptidase [Anaerolineae bacterium]|nr:C39 family peptidase [Anaerolineae bacterium]